MDPGICVCYGSWIDNLGDLNVLVGRKIKMGDPKGQGSEGPIKLPSSELVFWPRLEPSAGKKSHHYAPMSLL